MSPNRRPVLTFALAAAYLAAIAAALTPYGPTTVQAQVQAPQQDASFAAVDACVQQEMGRRNTPGASLAIAIDGMQAYTQTYGVKRSGGSAPVLPSSYFRINSTTKMMAAAAVLKQVESGALDLHAPLTDALPDVTLRPPWQASDLTLHHLLSGTSGLFGPYVAHAVVTPDRRPPTSLSLMEWADTLRHHHLAAPPGSFFHYSSVGFSVAAAALEQVTETPFAEVVRRDLWEPAGMLRTTMDPAVVLADGDFAHGHMWGQTWLPDAWSEEWSQAGGGAYGTPTELLTWAGMLAEGGRDVLAPESVAAMTSPQVMVSNVPIATYTAYGYGVFVEDFRPREAPGERVRVLYHPGNGRGYSTELFWVPETGFAVAILANTPAGLQDSALCALRELEGLTRLPADRSAPSKSTLERYTGSWAMVDAWGKTWTARVWQAAEGLRIRYEEWSALPSIDSVVPDAAMEHRHGGVYRYGGYGNHSALYLPALWREGTGAEAWVGAARGVDVETGLDAGSRVGAGRIDRPDRR